MTTKTHTFNSLDEVLGFIQAQIKELEEGPTAPTEEVVELDDFEIRRHVIRFVVDHIGFNSAEEFKQYVEFIYEFMVAASDE